MEAIYFFIFCIGISVIIFWCLMNDDQADFTGQKRDEKFKAGSGANNEEKELASDDKEST